MSVAPFGIMLGSPAPDDFERVDRRAYFGTTPPAAHPSFVEYLCVSGRSGVAKIVAYSSPIENDDYGSRARELFDRVSSQLSGKYGSPDHSDFIKHDALWDGEREWAQAIRAGERFYLSFWTEQLPEGLAGVALKVEDHEGYALRVVLSYEGDNWSDVLAEIEQEAADVL